MGRAVNQARNHNRFKKNRASINAYGPSSVPAPDSSKTLAVTAGFFFLIGAVLFILSAASTK